MKLKLPSHTPMEGMLIFGSAFVFAASAGLYFGKVSLQGLLFGSSSEKFGRPLGHIGEMRGVVLLQSRGEVEFKPTTREAVVRDNDTLFTGQDGTAKVVLDDEGTLVLAKNTLVRLTDEMSWSLSGISRATRAQVAAGEIAVTPVKRQILVQAGLGKAVPALPNGQTERIIAPAREAVSPVQFASPVPLASSPPLQASGAAVTPPSPRQREALVTLLSSELSEPLRLPAGSKKLEFPITLRFQISGAKSTSITVKTLKGQVTPGEVARKVVAVVNGEAKLPIVLKQPGQYEWVVEGDDRGPGWPAAARGEFYLEPEFQGLKSLEAIGPDPKVAPKHKYSTTLRWTPFPGAKEYTVEISSARDFSAPSANVLQAHSASDSYRVERDQPLPGKLFYRINAKLPGGFVVVSDVRPFAFQLSSPKLGSKAQLGTEDLLVTWVKSDSADEYEIEISKTNDFKRSLVKERVTDNLYVLHGAAPGHYWWRVRTVSGGVLSSPEPARELVVTSSGP